MKFSKLTAEMEEELSITKRASSVSPHEMVQQ